LQIFDLALETVPVILFKNGKKTKMPGGQEERPTRYIYLTAEKDLVPGKMSSISIELRVGGEIQNIDQSHIMTLVANKGIFY